MVSAGRAKMKRIKELMNKLLVLLVWTKAHREIVLLYVEDLSVFVRRRHRYHPNRFQKNCDIDRGDCYRWIGLSPSDMMRLYVCWRVPLIFTASICQTYGGEECFIIFMFHMIKGIPFTEMACHTTF